MPKLRAEEDDVSPLTSVFPGGRSGKNKQFFITVFALIQDSGYY